MNLVIFFIIQVMVAVGVLLFIKFFFSTQLTGAMKKLQVLNKENLLREAQVKEELKKAQMDRHEKVEEGNKIAGEAIEDAKEEAGRILENAREEAKLEIKRLLEEGKKKAEQTQTTAFVESRRVSQEWAKELVLELFSDKSKVHLHEVITDEFVEALKEVDSGVFSNEIKEVQVSTPIRLDEKKVEKVKKVLKEKVGHSVEVVQELNESLIAGILVHLPEQVIDGSFMNRLKRGVEQLEAKQNKDEDKAA